MSWMGHFRTIQQILNELDGLKKANYEVTILGNGDTESLYFWTHQKHY